MANHTATHVLHKALRDVLGDHVKQAGSAVRPDKLRFDFTHPQALSVEEQERVAEIVNEIVFANLPVRWYETPIEEARNLGAMMLFGEKYGDVVRVVEIGDGWSRELCGGTHVRSTAEIGPFAILSEQSVGSGVRRIEAVTSGEAFAWLRERAHEADRLRGEVEQLKRDARKPAKAEAAAELVWEDQHDGVFVAEVRGARGAALRDLSDQLREQKQALAVLLGTADEGKVSLVVNFDRSLPEERGLDAVAVIRELGSHIGGGGGGRPTLAEAGGKRPEGLRDALQAGRDAVVAKLT
jgi:alanyl-tRNA synthetase